ncbi:MAG: hypothetical protein GC166_05475 [Alphaproteobacteria bacterium]|nr:hypothetical protein [Alphaproteobacteria bacterium]
MIFLFPRGAQDSKMRKRTGPHLVAQASVLANESRRKNISGLAPCSASLRSPFPLHTDICVQADRSSDGAANLRVPDRLNQ